MKLLSGMFCCQNIPLFGHCDMSINFCNINRAVPEHFLNIADIHIRFQQACGEGMPEHMRGNM